MLSLNWKNMEAKKKLFHSRPLFYGFLALMLAISTSKYIFEGNVRYIVFIALLLIGFTIYCIWAKKFTTILIILCIFLFGVGWYFLGISSFVGKDFQESTYVVGRVSDDIELSKYKDYQTIVLKDVYIDGNKEKNICLKVDIKNGAELKAGQIISFEANVEQAKIFTLGKFNSFYERQNTPYVCSIASEDCVVQGYKLKFDEKLRLKLKNTLNEKMGEDYGPVGYAVLFGDKSGIDNEIKESFNSAGIIHLLTVSGLHVSFLIAVLGYILKLCHVRGFYNFAILALFLGLYAWLCGFAPSILRAGVMGLVLVTTKLSGKCYDNLNSLGFAGILILLFRPLSSMDLGFLMSFFCVQSIFVVTPWLKKILNKILPKFMAESIAVSIAAQIGVLPFLGSMNASFNFLTFFVNLLVIPIFSIIYPVLFVGSFLSAGMSFMGFLLKPCAWGLSLIQKTAQFFGESKLQIPLEGFDIFFVALMFIGLFLLSKFFMSSKKTKVICCSSLFALGGIFGGLSFIQQPVTSSISYCYNFSDSIVVLTNSSGNSVLVDFSSKNFTKKLLDRLNIKKVDTAFVLQEVNVDIETSRAVGVERIIRSDAGNGFEEEILVKTEQYGAVSGFSFVYRSYKNRLLGLEIVFDETKVFILRDWKTTEESILSIINEKYDFVILGKQIQLAEKFDKDCKILTYNKSERSNSSYEKDGNITFKIDGKKYLRRCLD